MINNKNKNAFTLVELLAVIVILAVVILIAVTAVIPRMNSAKKKALVDEALMYLKAAKESIVFDGDQSPSCINVSNLNENYIKKSSDSYTGVVKNEYVNGELSQTINLTNGSLYIVGTDNLTSADVKSTMPKGFASSCAEYNPVIAEGADTNTLAYKLLMSEGGSTIDANLEIINTRSQNFNFATVETNTSNSGIYKTEDDDGASFYYRGVVDNNWVSFGGFYWRIIRINGDGSIRMIYSGLASSNHTGDNATILTTKNTHTATFTDITTRTVTTKDISGLTNNDISISYSNSGAFNTHSGYMYNPTTDVATFPNKLPSSSEKLDTFPKFSNIKTNETYYYFKDFDEQTDCITSGTSDNSNTCIIKCRKYGQDGDSGIDCISGLWSTVSTASGNYSTTGEGSTSTLYRYTSDYKYTCWRYGTPTVVNNNDGTTSVYVACALVSEILGTDSANATQARVRHRGVVNLTAAESNSNVLDSNAKKEVDTWYQNNIYNTKDASNVNYLEEYLADEYFCNDRSSETQSFPLTETGGTYLQNPGLKMDTSLPPSLKCPNKGRDAFTLNSSASSIVQRKNSGNQALTYPVGLITYDEVQFAGSKYNTANSTYYLNTGKDYATMSPLGFNATNMLANIMRVRANGSLNFTNTGTGNGIRPVINLKASVLYDSGSGTEADPYKVKLAS